MTSCLIYTRISDDQTGEGLGVERQEQDCRKLAERKGWRVLDVLSDNDASGFKAVKRPGYDRLVKMLTNGEAQAVVAYGQDRLARSVIQLEQLLATGAQVACCKSGDLDTTSPQGRQVARILGAVAQGFSENMAADIKRKNRQKAEQGIPRSEGGRRFGYTAEWKVDPTEAKLIRGAVKTILAGGSVKGIAERWRAAGVLSPAGKAYAPTSLRRMLQRPYLRGDVEYLGSIYPGTWTPIVSREDHEAIVLTLTNPARRTNDGTKDSYTLTGSVFCGKCGSQLWGSVRAGRPSYRCNRSASTPDACNGITVQVKDVEPVVRDKIAKRIAKSGKAIAKRMAAGSDNAGMLAELVALRARRDDALDLFATGSLGKGDVARITGKIDAEIATLEGALQHSQASRALGMLPATAEDALNVWATAPKTLVALLVERITILPAVRKGAPFTKDRVAIDWK